MFTYKRVWLLKTVKIKPKIGPWSSGPHACLLLWQSKFKSHWSLTHLSVKFVFEKTINKQKRCRGLGHLKENRKRHRSSQSMTSLLTKINDPNEMELVTCLTNFWLSAEYIKKALKLNICISCSLSSRSIIYSLIYILEK